MSRNGAVAGVTSLRAGRPRFRGSIPGRGKALFFFQDLQLGSGTHISFFSVVTFDSCANGLKQLGREADYIPPPSADVMNAHTFID